MLLPSYFNGHTDVLVYQINKYYVERVQNRVLEVQSSIQDVCKIVQNILKEVELQEPRFVSSLTECNGKYEGLEVVTPCEFEVVLYLNQMGVFNFVDDGTLPGCAVLKLSDGRKRSMSLWVEFITASGYLSARKIRSRFQSLVSQACDKCKYGETVKVISDTTDVKLKIRERFVVQITPAFKCTGVWPRSASQWPSTSAQNNATGLWPYNNLIADVKTEGFDLLSKDSIIFQQSKQSALEGDAWILSFTKAELRLLKGGYRHRCLSILKTLRDRHLDLPGNPVTGYHIKTLLLYECEKHPLETEWDENCVGDRIVGILVQLISCLQCRKCPHYFLPSLNLFKGKSASALEGASKQVWRVVRELVTNSRALETL
ncbi:protein mab-21-like [Microplitis demolitor]|uniref:protein mab-21-like n=1 Tax=Microplitis demolitor TaxID=69319 RepID=UPI0006D4E52F|nr:protein mab-21-like [Microplitis demolitor]